MVVDSPPGSTRASTADSSPVVRTSVAAAPRSFSAWTWRTNAPWRARTPTFIARSSREGAWPWV